MKKYFLILFSLLMLASCRQSNTPSTPSGTYATTFNLGQLEYYGAYYAEAGLESGVMAIDLYSEGLTLNRKGYMVGTGTNLYFSDIFIDIADSANLKKDAVYSSDTTGMPLTFLPGTYYEGNFTGAYLLSITEGQLTGYTLIPEGSLSLQTSALGVTTISFEGKLSNGKKYTCDYEGRLQYQDKRHTVKVREFLQ